MNATIEQTASEAASNALDYLNGKKSRIIIGQTKIETKRKSKLKYLLLVFIVAFVFPFFLTTKKYQVKGSVHINGNFAKNHQINFLDKNDNLIKIESDNSGNFQLSLKEGIYKIYLTGAKFKKYSNPKTTPFSLKLSKNINELRIYVPKNYQ